jgi:hypothetical protein
MPGSNNFGFFAVTVEQIAIQRDLWFESIPIR